MIQEGMIRVKKATTPGKWTTIMNKIFKEMTNWFLSEKAGLWRLVIFLASLFIVSLIGWFLANDIWQIAGFVFIFIGIFGGILTRAVIYLENIYEVHAFGKAIQHLWSALFGFGFPSLKIVGGRRDLSPGEVNILDRIGGPGILTVEPGNVVIMETLLAPARILGAGEHKIKRGEMIKDVITLEEYSGKIDKITVSTRDGIDVKVTNVEFRFSINPSSQATGMRTIQNPYPFSRKSVHDLVYNRDVGVDGVVGSWTGAVEGAIKGIIVEHISAHDMDTLLSPALFDTHPMFDLRGKFDLPKNQDKIKAAGARLLWINIGNVAPELDAIEKQRLEVWLAKQSGVEKIMQAQGEAEKISSRERGRAEAQAVLLRSIAQALQEIDPNGKHDKATTAKNLWNIVMARTAQILESMGAAQTPKDKKRAEHG
jgi:hypothetical protein